jgi:hypothetical protein
MACVERALDLKETRPEDSRGQRRQAIFAVLFGVSAWLLLVLGALLFVGRHDAVILSGLITLLSLVPALFGVGQGAASIRVRGSSLVVATWGLVLSGVHLGTTLGLCLLLAWNS